MLTFHEFRGYAQAAVPNLGVYWLNRRQEAAVEAAPVPPVFIVAGPGTGKTTVLALRALKLILVDQLRPAGIMATTFTRKAATELRSRVLSWGYAIINEAVRRLRETGDQVRLAWLDDLDLNAVQIGTLDSLAREMLRNDREPGEVAPVVVERFMAQGLLRRRVLFAGGYHRNDDLEEHLCSFNPIRPHPISLASKLGVCQRFADRVLHDGVDLDRYASMGTGHRLLADIVDSYHTYLEGQYLADFAMLEAEILRRLQGGRLEHIDAGIQALLVDEFQDTNFLQEQIYYALCRRTGAAFTVVGDDDQSIYRFRGATVEIFADFPNRITDYLGPLWEPNRYDLVDNYRSSQRIIGLYNHYINIDPDYLDSRAPGKLPCQPAATWTADQRRNVPVLGLFRPDVETLAGDVCDFLMGVFRCGGYAVRVGNGQAFTIRGAENGDFGDAVYLSWRVQEYAANQRVRLPLLLRQLLRAEGVGVFNPRGRSLASIPEVEICLGLMLECIDPDARVQGTIRSIGRGTIPILNRWRQAARRYAAGDPAPGGLDRFVADWGARRPVRMESWPREWPLLELLFTIVTWLPLFQDDPEGQVYLEAVARTIAQAAQIGAYSSRILHNTEKDDASVREAIREVFEAIADGNAQVNEDIMPYVPHSFFPLMTVHQAKGLEFPLVVVDVGSDFKRNHYMQAKYRYPRDGDNIHFTEDHVADFTSVGVTRLTRSGRQRAFNDVRRLYYVAKSRAENVLVLVGLMSQLQGRNMVRSVALGDDADGGRHYQFVPAEEWSPEMQDNTIVLI